LSTIIPAFYWNAKRKRFACSKFPTILLQSVILFGCAAHPRIYLPLQPSHANVQRRCAFVVDDPIFGVRRLSTSPTGQVFGLVCISFAAGMTAISAFEKLFLGESHAGAHLMLALLMSFSTFTMGIMVRKLIP